MIYYFTPYALDGYFGRAINESCKIVPNNEDWICIRDGDTSFITEDWGKIIAENIAKYPDTGLFTCITNRSGRTVQLRSRKDFMVRDIRKLAQIAKDQAYRQRHVVSILSNAPAGYFMLFKKSTWLATGGFSDTKGILGADIRFGDKVLKLGMPIRILYGLYIFHYYRMLQGPKNTKHLRV
jgi:GT2 family glycosyltransferase